MAARGGRHFSYNTDGGPTAGPLVEREAAPKSLIMAVREAVSRVGDSDLVLGRDCLPTAVACTEIRRVGSRASA